MTPLHERLHVHQGDITRLQVDAIVNAANTSLLGGGGVDGAIHRAAGPELAQACRPLGGCQPGQAKATPGFRLPARWVIHTVGPVWQGGYKGEPEVLAACYTNSLARAAELGARAIAFPAISTGRYGYPPDRAALVAARACAAHLREHALPEQVTFCMFDAPGVQVMGAALDAVAPTPPLDPGLQAIQDAFMDAFATWNLHLPTGALRARQAGRVDGQGWTIDYRFGRVGDREHLDVYARHRMTNDRLTRLWSDGSAESLGASLDMMVGLDAQTQAMEADFRALVARLGFRP